MTWAACVGQFPHACVTSQERGTSCFPRKKREAWKRGSFTERGRGAVFKASTPHDHGVGRGRFTRPLGSARPPRILHAPGMASGGGGKPGRRWLGQWVGPDSLRLWWLDWPSGAAEPCSRLLIKRGKGGRHPTLFRHLSPLASASSFHSPWRRGILVPRWWRRGSPLDSASLLLLSPRWWNRR